MLPYGSKKHSSKNPYIQGLICREDLDDKRGLKRRARREGREEIEEQLDGGSSNGRIAGFDPVHLGSSPSPPATDGV